jgi:outer membrane protein assembly factor BamB
LRISILCATALLFFTGCPKREKAPAPAPSAITTAPSAKPWQSLASKRRIPSVEKDKGASLLHAVPGTSLLLVHEGSGWSVYPLGADKPSAHLAEKADYRVTEKLAGALLLRGEPTGITAFDAKTLTKAWSLATPDWMVDNATLLDDGSTLVLAIGKDTLANELVVVDAKTGAKKWSTPLYPSTAHHAYAGGNLVVLAKPDGTTALEGTTGKELWKRPHYGENGEFYDLVTTERLLGRYGVLVDARTGKDAPKIEGVQEFSRIVRSPSGVVVALESTMDGGVVALDLVNAKVKWKATLPRHDSNVPTGLKTPLERTTDGLGSLHDERSYPYSLAVDDDAVFATRGDGVIHAFNLTDGKERWTWSLLGGGFAIVPGPPFTLYAIQDGVVEVFEEGKVPPERATITGIVTEAGKPLAQKEIWIGATKTQTDENGKFSGAFEGNGNVRVVLHAPAPTPPGESAGLRGVGGFGSSRHCFHEASDLVRLQGLQGVQEKRSYDVKLAAEVSCRSSF